jgi:NADH dehydrogenase FAD-containing subunit
MSEKRVVVIGNGPAGSQFTASFKKIAKNSNSKIIVISAQKYTEIALGMTSVVAIGAGPAGHDKFLYPAFEEPEVEYIYGTAASLTKDSVTLSDGRIVPFNAAVVATGIKFPVFRPTIDQVDAATRKAFIQGYNDKLKAAKTIVVVGAGPVGAELAADIKLRYTDKRIILVDAASKAVASMNTPFSEAATKTLERFGIELILNTRVTSHTDTSAVLSNGKTLSFDLLIESHAEGPNSGFLPSELLDDKGFVKVNDFLQTAYPSVFALGDVSAYDHVKTYTKIADQLPTIVKNVDALLLKKQLTAHKRNASFYGQLKGPLLVAFGHDLPNGVGVGPDLPGFLGICCFACCCFGYPCQHPQGHNSNAMKSNFNTTIKPQAGKGINQ